MDEENNLTPGQEENLKALYEEKQIEDPSPLGIGGFSKTLETAEKLHNESRVSPDYPYSDKVLVSHNASRPPKSLPGRILKNFPRIDAFVGWIKERGNLRSLRKAEEMNTENKKFF